MQDSMEDLAAFKRDCIDRKNAYPNFARSINRLSLRSAQIASLRVVRKTNGTRFYNYLFCDITLPAENANTQRMRSSFGLDHVDEDVGLALRVQLGDLEPDPTPGEAYTLYPFTPAKPVELCYELRLSVVCDSSHRRNAHQNTVRRADFCRLRVHHLLDLFRVMRIEVDPNYLNDLNAWFPQAVVNTLEPFSSGWEGEHPVPDTATHRDFELMEIFSTVFCSRWITKDKSGSLRLDCLRALPIDGPLFYFDVPETSYYAILTTAVSSRSSPPPPVIHRTLSEFCEHILGPGDPPEGYTRIVHFTRYQLDARFRHQFVVFAAELNILGLQMGLWLRIDRTANRDARVINSSILSSSTFAADDRVQISTDPSDLFDDGDEITVLYKHHVGTQPTSESSQAEQITLRGLAKALRIFCGISKNYVFLTENCYYLATLIQEVVTSASDTAGARTWARFIPTETRDCVLRLWKDARDEEVLMNEIADDINTIGDALAKIASSVPDTGIHNSDSTAPPTEALSLDLLSHVKSGAQLMGLYVILWAAVLARMCF